MNKTKIAIDRGDVLIDFNEGIRRYHNEHYATNYLAEDVKGFNLQDV